MKTQILILLLSASSIVSFASNPDILTEKAKMLTLITSAWKSEKVNVQIKDFTGSVILDETVKNGNKVRRYNLKNLPNGNYTLEMSNELKITVQEFEILGSQVILSNTLETEYKPVINLFENHIDLNLMTLGKEASLKILDETNNVLLTEKLAGPVVSKRYDFSKLSSGDYAVIVEINGRSYTKSVVK
ncbi:MAG: hypothetical protein H7X99_07720 [Saprospiraceae bacterium]|nr:hypothetical protein [Saprospiraceae bacterium]